MNARISAEAPALAPTLPVPGQPTKEWMSVQGALKLAADHFNAGRFAEALSIAEQVKAARPDIADAWNIIAVSQHRMGRTEDGIQSLKQAIKLNSRNPGYYANLGEMQRRMGRPDAAITALNKAIRLNARAYPAWNNLGIVHYEKKHFAKAAECYRQALAIQPNYAEAHNNLGNALRNLGQFDEAIAEYEQALALRPDYPEACNNMGTVLRDQNRLAEAEQAYRRAISLRPKYFDARNNLANVLIQRRQPDLALRLLTDLLAERPGDRQALLNVARAHIGRRDYAAAEKVLRQILAASPDLPEALTVYAELCHETDRFDDALAMLRKVTARQPENPEAWNLIGLVHKALGAMDDARAAFKRTLKLQPAAIDAYANMLDIETFTPDHPLLPVMEQQLAALPPEAEDDRVMVLNFALGKAYDDMGDYGRAIDHYRRATALRRRQLKYNEAATLSFFDDVRKVFTAEFLASSGFDGNQSDRPLFIVGFPRSGSTLVEQILASHPQVYGAGEVKHLPNVLSSLHRAVPSLPSYPAIVRAMTAPQMTRVAKLYLDRLSAGAGNARRITDKLLANFYLVGLIHLLFPRAKIVHTMRDPVDTCLSSWTKLFRDDMPHSYDLGELGRYYVKYAELMDHWRAVLPAGTMLDIQYEDVVRDLEGNARRLIDFVGLPWDDACLAFHKSRRPVKTASAAAVRKPLYDAAVGRWRRYEDHIGPLLAALGDRVRS